MLAVSVQDGFKLTGGVSVKPSSRQVGEGPFALSLEDNDNSIGYCDRYSSSSSDWKEKPRSVSVVGRLLLDSAVSPVISVAHLLSGLISF